jgi:hypothetical protein
MTLAGIPATGHMDAEAVFAAAWHQLADEDHLITNLPDGHIIITYPWHRGGHFVQLVVVSCKQHLGPENRMFVQKLDMAQAMLIPS